MGGADRDPKDVALMEHPGFFRRAGPFSIEQIAAAIATHPPAALLPTASTVHGDGPKPDVPITDVKPIGEAGSSHVAFVDNRKFLPELALTHAGACFVHPNFVDRVPSTTLPLVTKAPYTAFALALQLFYPDAMRPLVCEPGASHVAASAELEEGVIVEPGAIVGPGVCIGRGSRIASGAVIGARCFIGRDSYIGPNAVVIHALVGDHVIIHAGAKIGQDGFGFAMGRSGHIKVPQIGRVIIQDRVEIGANTCIDRGALKDTIIGEGTKIDNLVQIGHNVVIGRHAVIVGQVGLAGSCELGDFVVMGGHSGVVGHVKVGAGVQIAGSSHVNEDIPAGLRVGGTPAVPFRDWARQIAAIKRLGMKSHRTDGKRSSIEDGD